MLNICIFNSVNFLQRYLSSHMNSLVGYVKRSRPLKILGDCPFSNPQIFLWYLLRFCYVLCIFQGVGKIFFLVYFFFVLSQHLDNYGFLCGGFLLDYTIKYLEPKNALKSSKWLLISIKQTRSMVKIVIMTQKQ